MKKSLFLLGAGFNMDTLSEAGELPVQCSYPLIKDLWKICFDLNSVLVDKSIEQLFAEALQEKNQEPLRRLSEVLMEADYYIGKALAYDQRKSSNLYVRFLERFSDSSFMTFNYDSLLEILLFGLKRWRPEDGFGVPVQAQIRYIQKPVELPEHSKNIVLHLHGSLCLWTSEFYIKGNPRTGIGWLTERGSPEFIFDPDMIGDCFFPYDRILTAYDYKRIEDRIIAPVPSKAERFKDTFIQMIYDRAKNLINESHEVIAIGYRFNPLDSDSFNNLLWEIERTKCRFIIIGQEVDKIKQRLCSEYRQLIVKTIPLTFRQWAKADFPVN